MSNYISRVTLRHVQLGRGRFRNFAGRKTEYNKDGKRTITLFLDDETAAQLKDDGWNVKYYIPKKDDMDDGEPQALPILEAELRYDNYPPTVKLEMGGAERELEEDDLESLNLDTADITDVDVRLSPYTWHNARGESGIKAYVDKLRIRMDDDF